MAGGDIDKLNTYLVNDKSKGQKVLESLLMANWFAEIRVKPDFCIVTNASVRVFELHWNKAYNGY